MKKVGFIICLALLANTLLAQKGGIKPNIKKLRNDTVVWRADSLLTKEDFKSKAKGPAMGFTAGGIFLYPNESNSVLVFNVEAIFVKSKSYITKFSEYVLKHEQLHFDICELYARKLRQKISELDFKKVKNVAQVIDNAYKKFSGEMMREEEKYDKDTEHGLNAAKQQVWADNIQKQIKDLDAYSGTEINTVK